MKLIYRPEIDGLRAIAVLAVVFYHAFPNALIGGYLGVDVFFVISGYLITTILLQDLKKGSFTYLSFYSRRIKRIYPALLLMVSCCLLLGWYCLLADEYKQLGKHTFAGMAFISNLALLTELDYFDVTSELKPLLHLWSLAVEEQFYIIWPVILSIFFCRKKYALPVIYLMTITSFTLHMYYSVTYPSAAFYLPVTRFWELSIGGLLAYLIHHNKLLMKQNEWLSLAGITMIIGSFIIVDSQIDFLPIYTLLPTLGTALIIYSSTNTVIGHTILSNKTMLFIGAISYPLYLWHWPLMVFPRVINGGELNLSSKLFYIALSFILAYLTYRFLEKKIKNNSRVIITMLILSITLLVLGFLSWKKVIQVRNASPEISMLSDAMNDWTFPDNLEPFQFHNFTFYRSSSTKNEKVLFIGDSLIQQYSPLFKLNKDNKKIKQIIMAAQGGCIPIPQSSNCSNYVTAAHQYSLDNNVTNIIIGACWDCYFIFDKNKSFNKVSDVEQAYKNLQVFLTKITKNTNVYLLLSSPTGGLLDPKQQMFGSRFNQLEVKSSLLTITLSEEQKELRKKLKAIAKAANVEIIDPIIELCDKNICPATTERGVPLFKDRVHMRPFYVEQSVNYLNSIIYSNAN